MTSHFQGMTSHFQGKSFISIVVRIVMAIALSAIWHDKMLNCFIKEIGSALCLRLCFVLDPKLTPLRVSPLITL
jgi:hypothetical protein